MSKPKRNSTNKNITVRLIIKNSPNYSFRTKNLKIKLKRSNNLRWIVRNESKGTNLRRIRLIGFIGWVVLGRIRNKAPNRTSKLSDRTSKSKTVELTGNQSKSWDPPILNRSPEVIVQKDGECQQPDRPKLSKWTIRSFKIRTDKIERGLFNQNFSIEDEL